MKIRLKQAHTHAGVRYEKDAELAVPKDLPKTDAAWLIAQGGAQEVGTVPAKGKSTTTSKGDDA